MILIARLWGVHEVCMSEPSPLFPRRQVLDRTGGANPSIGHLDALRIGTRVAEFEIKSLLGVGGFGMVYSGYDHSLHRPVAIKEYMPSSLAARSGDASVVTRSPADELAYQSGLRSFMAEARLLAKFDHPSLVKVYRFWEINNTAYMAMPLYSGITLKQARKQMSGPPPEEWLRKVLWPILEALKVLHAHNTLHRDVSPDNIFLQDVGSPVLLDLGAARRAIADHSQKHTAVLKVNYAPIEQYAEAQDVREGPWTDLYSLAAVVHNCLCNEAPLPATFRVVKDRMPSFARVAHTVETHFGLPYSSSFVKAIDHALCIQPEQRPQTVEAFAAEMRLRAPDGMTRFDWRLQLGDRVSLNENPGAPEVISEFSGLQAPTQVMDYDEVDLPVSIPDRFGNPGEKPTTRGKWMQWLWSIPFLIAAVLIAPFIKGQIDKQLHTSPAAVEQLPPATSQTQTTPIPISPPAPAASVEPVQQASAVTPSPMASPVSSQVQEAKPVESPPADAAAPAEVAKATAPKPVKRHEAKVVPKKKSAATEPVKPSPTLQAPDPSPQGNPEVPEKASIPAVALCADTNILFRSMCLYRECQKPANASLPVCVEAHKEWSNTNTGGVRR